MLNLWFRNSFEINALQFALALSIELYLKYIFILIKASSVPNKMYYIIWREFWVQSLEQD